jgi:hypothetical protein
MKWNQIEKKFKVKTTTFSLFVTFFYNFFSFLYKFVICLKVRVFFIAWFCNQFEKENNNFLLKSNLQQNGYFHRINWIRCNLTSNMRDWLNMFKTKQNCISTFVSFFVCFRLYCVCGQCSIGWEKMQTFSKDFFYCFWYILIVKSWVSLPISFYFAVKYFQ